MASTASVQLASGGSIPASSLHFRTGRRQEAESMVIEYHYSRRIPSNIQMVGSLHLDGGLFGGDGPMMAASFWSIPPTRWAEPVLELSRLVRGNEKVPLTMLISKSVKELRRKGYDLLVSFADKTQGHEGYVYRAANWNYSGCNEKRMDGLLINGSFVAGRTSNHMFGTQSPTKLSEMFPHKEIVPHYDEGKHCYWLALNKKGSQKAQRLGLVAISPK